ncbi:MAG: hypothetical protein NTY98_01130 [Verrucomicrobia bacterium]|nr:hypothetical protein [Verrucomicrobiota bacterium]
MLTPRIKRTLLCLIAVCAALIVHADEFDPKDSIIVLGGRVGLIQAQNDPNAF